MDEARVGSKRILIATIGSLGDLHPCLALGTGLKARGHRVSVAATELFRSRIEGAGLEFRPMRPHWAPDDAELIRDMLDMRRGPEALYRRMLLPVVREMYVDLAAAAAEADLLIAGEIVVAAPLVAEMLGLKWASAILSPMSFLSAYDPSVLPGAPVLERLRFAGAGFQRALLGLGRMSIRHWWVPLREFRRELGLRAECDPVFRDKFSRDLVLAMFSREMGAPQRDWPGSAVQTGFVYYDKGDDGARMPEELAEFLDDGEAPVVFTLGSTAVNHPGSFYRDSVEAMRLLGRRAVFLVGGDGAMEGLPAGSIAVSYAPYSELFPRAAAVVHQGGIGTTAQALRAGIPMLVVPYLIDQPDNGARVRRMGAGLLLSRKAYSGRTAARSLLRLLEEKQFAARARLAGERLRQEDGLGAACDAVERLLLTGN